MYAACLRNETRRGNLLKEVFSELYDINDTSILHRDRFLFIFDGFDELGIHFNLFDDCHLQAWASHSMFIITSRLGFLSMVSWCFWRHSVLLKADIAKCIAPHVNSMQANLDRVQQVFLAPFTQQQKLEYITNFAASKHLNSDEWSAAQFRVALDASPELAGLASSPLMLFMVLNILPSISDAKPNTDCNHEVCSKMTKLYACRA